MEGSKLINYTYLSKLLGYSPKYVRRGKKIRSADDQKAIKEFEAFAEKWAKKYTRTK
jgi:hypothetical protein